MNRRNREWREGEAPSPYPPPSRGRGLAEIGVITLVLFVLGGLGVYAEFGPLDRAKELKCANNLAQIGVAFTMRAQDKDGFPPAVNPAKEKDEPARARFAWLMKEGYITNPKPFICPSSQEVLQDPFPKDVKGAKVEDLVMSADHCSYGMDTDKTAQADGSAALVSDKPKEEGRHQDSNVNSVNHAGQGQNVLYVDGSVKWSRTLKSDSGRDDNIFAGNKDGNSLIDSNIDP